MNRVMLVLAAALLAACQTVSDSYYRFVHGGRPAAPPAELVAIKQPAATPKILWQGGVGSAEKDIFYPAVSGNTVYAAGASGQIVGFDAVKGGATLKMEAGQRISGGVGIGAGAVYVGTGRGEVLAYNLQGKQLWKAQLFGEVLAPPLAQDGVVVARSADGRLYGLNAVDGKRRWVYQRTAPVLSVRTYAGVIARGGGVFAGFPGGRLVVLGAATGNVAWEGVVAIPRGTTELERVADITSLPALDDERVCAVSFQGRVACFDVRNGSSLWSRDASSVAGLALDARYLYYTDDKDAVVALDKASGASIWKQDKMSGRRVSGPLPFGRYVVVGDYQGQVHLLSREDGSFAARIATDGSAINAAPVALDLSSFLVQTAKGGIFAISVQ